MLYGDEMRHKGLFFLDYIHKNMQSVWGCRLGKTQNKNVPVRLMIRSKYNFTYATCFCFFLKYQGYLF